MNAHIIRINYVQHEGLKAHDARRGLTGADVYTGANGTSKTTLLDTIRLVVLGHTVGIKKTNQDVFSLAKPGVERIRLLLGGTLTDGRKTEIERRWTRTKKGAIEESIAIDGVKLGTRDGEAAIRALVPWMDEALEPVAIFREPPAAMRARILALAPSTAIKLEDVVPADVPKWALAKHSDMAPARWVEFAIEQTDAKINAAQAERRTGEAVLRRLVDTTEVEASTDKPTAEIEAELATLREELTGCSVSKVSRQVAERDETTARAKLDAARAAIARTSMVDDVASLATTLFECLPSEDVARRVHDASANDYDLVRRAAEAIRTGLTRSMTDAPMLERRRAELVRTVERVRAFPVSTHEAHAAAKVVFDEVNARVRPVEDQLAGLRGELRALTPASKAEPTDALGVAIAAWRSLPAGRRNHLEGYFHEEAAEQRDNAADYDDLDARLFVEELDIALVLLEAAALPTEDTARAARREEIQRQIDALEIDVDLLHAERDEAADAVMRAEAGAKRAEAERELAEIETKLAAIAAERPTIPAEVKQPATWLHGIEERVSEIFAAETSAATAREALADLEAAHTAAKAALEALPAGRSREDIEVAIADAEARLDAVKAHNANAVRVREALATLAKIATNEEALKSWRARFVEIQTGLVDKARAWFETRYSELLGGAPVEVRLATPTGAPDCRILVDGIEVRTMCPGHQAFALVMFLLLLSGARKGGFRFLPIDALEGISKENRPAFLGALQDALKAGQIDQWIATGCPDSVPEIEGVTVHDMSESLPIVPETTEDDDAPIPEPTEPPRRRTKRGPASAYDAA